jgi:hypothetical protein
MTHFRQKLAFFVFGWAFVIVGFSMTVSGCASEDREVDALISRLTSDEPHLTEEDIA